MRITARRGDILFVDLGGARGNEIQKRRPCVIVSNDTPNRFSTTLIVAPIRAAGQAKLFPEGVLVRQDECPVLKKDSVVDCSQLRTIDRSRAGQVLGRLGPQLMQKVDRALFVAVGLKRNDGMGANETPEEGPAEEL